MPGEPVDRPIEPRRIAGVPPQRQPPGVVADAPAVRAVMITSSGPVSDSTVLATSTYFASPRATENVSRRAACLQINPAQMTIAARAAAIRR